MSRILLLVIILMFFSCKTKEIPEPESASTWITLQHDFRRTGQSQYEGPHYPKLKWKILFEDHAKWYSVAVIDSLGTIYISTDTGILYAINDGKIKWKYLTEKLEINGINRVYFSKISPINQVSSPIISLNKDILFGAPNGYLYAFNTEGNLNWKYNTNAPIYEAPVISSDNTIFVGNIKGVILAIKNNGQLIWESQINNAIVTSLAICDLTKTIYFGAGKKLYAINTTNGKTKWNFEAMGLILSSPLIDSMGNIYFGAGLGLHVTLSDNNNIQGNHYSYDDASIYALNSNGMLKWKFKSNGPVIYPGALDISENVVYFSSTDRNLYALNCDNGSLVWKVGFDKLSSPLVPIVDLKHNIYLGVVYNSIFSIDKNGKVRWRFEIDGNPLYLSLRNDGTLYTCGNSALYALQAD